MYAPDMERVRLCFELVGTHYQGFIRPYWHPPGYVFSVTLNTKWMGNLFYTEHGWKMDRMHPSELVDYLGNYIILWFE